MTKEQIIGALKAAAKPYEEYYIDDEVVDAINTYSNPYELVAPILEIILFMICLHKICICHSMQLSGNRKLSATILSSYTMILASKCKDHNYLFF